MDLNPWYRELSTEIGPTIIYRGAEVVMLGSNNYLGLTHRPQGEKGSN
jgi:7-keto-8-aminopelargonate synthetase-like enzyme